MKKISILFLSVFIGFGLPAKAEDAIEKFRNFLGSLGKSSDCQPGKELDSCDFKKNCKNLSKNSTSAVLLQDEDGRRINNYMMQVFGEASVNCGLHIADMEKAYDEGLILRNPVDAENADYARKTIEDLQIFAEVKADSLAYLNRLPISETEKKILTERMSSVKIEVMQPGSQNAESPMCHSPNAYYMITSHSILLCPQMINLPKDSLRFIFAHELGHSIDPCSLNVQLQKDSDGKIRAIWPDDFNENPKPIIGQVIPGSQNPFQDTMTCLAEQSPQEFFIPDMDSVTATARQELEYNKAQKNSTFIELSQNRLERKIKSYPNLKYCRGFAESGSSVEVFADWLAGEVMAQQIADGKKVDPRKAFGSFYMSDCPSVLEDTYEKFKKAPGASQCRQGLNIYKGNKKRLQETKDGLLDHPSTASRMEKIFLRNPEVAKAIGCEQRKHCGL